MSKYIKKLKSNENQAGTLNIEYSLGQSISCGNGYKNGTMHMYYSQDLEDIPLLLEIFKRFKIPVTITELKPNSFKFESATEVIQIFFFRLCRYTRTIGIRKILEDTILINKAGVTIQNAFLLAHYNNLNIPYYADTMDIVNGFKGFGVIHAPVKTLKEFKTKLDLYTITSMIYNNIYKTIVNRTKDRTLLLSLIENKDWKAANKFLLSLKLA
jgi:hypothetical protein